MKISSVVLVLVLALQAAGPAPAAESVPGTPAPAAPAPAPATGGTPKIVFAEREFEFGRIMSGQPVQHDFYFTNAGDAVLVITGVSPGCHCTTAGTFTSQVAPGKSGVIPIRFDGSGGGGAVAKSVVVNCNDPAQPVINLILKGALIVPLEPNTTFVTLNVRPDATTNVSAVVLLHNNTDAPITVGEPQSNHSGIAAELKTLRPGQDFELTIHTILGRITNNSFAAINLTTSHPAEPTLLLYANAIFLPAVALMQAQIMVQPPGQPAPTNGYRVTIVNNSVQPLSLSEPTVNIFGAKATVEETVPGQQFSVSLTLPPGFEVPPGTNYEMSVKTSNPQHAQIRVPIRSAPRNLPPGMRPPTPRPMTVPPVAPPATNSAAR